jgi:hypothetical protein
MRLDIPAAIASWRQQLAHVTAPPLRICQRTALHRSLCALEAELDSNSSRESSGEARRRQQQEVHAVRARTGRTRRRQLSHRIQSALVGILNSASAQKSSYLRKFSPRPLRHPPNQPAAPEDDDAQHNPSINSRGNYTRPKHKYRCDHGEIIWSRVAAMGTTALSCIQDARCTHPDERDGPDRSAWGHRREQTGKHREPRNPPRQQTATCAAGPVTRGLDRSVGHSLGCTACSRAGVAGAFALHRRTRHRAVGAEHATIAVFRP